MRSILVLTALALLAACSASHGGAGDAGGTATSCDPLTAKPITLGAIVGVGKDADGTRYVDSANGILLSDTSSRLIRQHVVGTGQSGATEFGFSFVAPGADESTARGLLVETNGKTATAMALGPTNSSSKAFLDQNPPGTTPLTLVDPSTVAGMPVVNTPNAIDYLADVANGDVILATVPMNDDETSTDGGLAIFYGPPANVAQRAITNFGETLSGNGSVTFLVDGTPYVLQFGEVAAPDAGPLGAFALLGLTPQGGAAMNVTLRSPTPTALTADLSFSCLP
jgi:hypothetical protein